MARSRKVMPVYLEAGSKKVFACAVDWPGWCRSGKSEELALEALAAYESRYAPVAAEAGLAFPTGVSDTLEVVERVAGNATTDFGAPSAVAVCDRRALSRKEGGRIAALLTGSWAVFDAVAAGAPAELRKGPRGGGRDRDKMIDHVLGAEVVYLRKLGLRFLQPDRDDAAAIDEMRQAVVAALGQTVDGEPPVERGWPVRYAVRRIAWHVLDHAWEMEDRTDS